MRLFCLFISFIFAISLSAQNDVIEINVLPSEYGEGMPLREFQEFEKNIIQYLDAVQRFKVIKRPADYPDLDWEGSLQEREEQIKAVGTTSSAPYFLHIIFGDTEWTSIATSSSPINAPSSTRYRSNNATLWITINLYNVATGILENSTTVKASSNEYPKYQGGSAANRMDFSKAVSAGQKSLWRKIKQRIHQLFPLEIQIKEINDVEENEAKTVTIDTGKFHGLAVGDQFYVYYEKEYIVRGKPLARHVSVGRLKILKLGQTKSLCQVKKGEAIIPELLKSEKQLKCKIIGASESSRHYGF